MPTHKDRAHLHAQETVAKTILAADHAKRMAAAQGRLPQARWSTRRQPAAEAGQPEAPLAIEETTARMDVRV